MSDNRISPTGFMAVVSEEADDRFVIWDPSLSPQKYEADFRKGRVAIKSGILILCDGETLDAEIGKHRLGYFHFWRKQPGRNKAGS